MAKSSASTDSKPTEASKADTPSGSSGAVAGATRKDDTSKGSDPKKVPGPDEQPTKSDKPKSFLVVKGKAITTKRGILGPGEEVTAKDFHAGEQRLRELVEAGVVEGK